MTKVLVIGTGFLGKYTVDEFKKNNFNVEYSFFKKKTVDGFELDITDEIMIDKIMSKIRPDVVVNCAANTDIDFLEENPKIAYLINSMGVKNLANSCKKYNSRLIHISTDSVFDGIHGSYNEKDIPFPVNVYGKSKLEGEKFVEDICTNYVVVRTNFFGYDPIGKHLFNWILNSLRNNDKIIGFSDVVFNPLEVSNLTEMLVELAVHKHTGIIHLSSTRISKYDFAIHIAKEFNCNENLIFKGTIEESNLKARRPKNTSLDNHLSKKLLKTKAIPIKTALKQIREKYYKE